MANQGASSSSAPFTKSWKYHVFLSFRGFDTRSNFTSHLYSALRQQGINTYMDDNELRRGEEISNALLTAIEDSKISVVVFSENYASSKWCLDELVKILNCKESNQQLVIPVFYKVDPSDVRNQKGSFGDALANMDCNNVEKVNGWWAALSQAGNLAGFTLPDDRESEAEFIQKIIEEISAHVIDRTYLKVAEHPVGMQPHVQDMNKLLDLGGNDVRMVGVWGTGGIGKTTVAKVVYNSIAHEFEGSCFLANVRERSTSHEGLAKLQMTLLFEILRGKKLKVANVDKGATMIEESLSCRKVLLVLDDVDHMKQLYKLAGACDWFGVGSRIIITTRNKQLLTTHDVNLIHEVKKLDDNEAMELFSWHAFKRRGPPLGDYAELAELAICYAQGLPLALTVLGSCLCRGTIDEWHAVLWDGFKATEIQDVLKISYNALDDRVKQVFLELACSFKGKCRRYAIKELEASDLNPRYGIEVLIEKALISVEGDYIQMHDLLEEMGKDIDEQGSPTELKVDDEPSDLKTLNPAKILHGASLKILQKDKAFADVVVADMVVDDTVGDNTSEMAIDINKDDVDKADIDVKMESAGKVNPSDVRNHRGSFGHALANMDGNNVEKDNGWRASLSQAGSLAGFTVLNDREFEAEFIQKIIEEISAHARVRQSAP